MPTEAERTKTKTIQLLRKVLPFTLTYVCGIIMLVVGTFFQEQIAFFKTDYTAWMNDAEFYITLVAFLLSVVLYYFLAIHYFHIKVKAVFLVMAVLLFVGNMVALLLDPSSEVVKSMGGSQVTVVLTTSDRIRDIILFGCGVIMVYTLLAVFPQVARNSRAISIAHWGTVIVCFVAIIYSLITEFPAYQALFDRSIVNPSVSDIKSFTYNRNNFAALMLFGCCSVGYLHCEHPRWWNYPILFILYIWNTLLFIQTTMFIGTIYMIAFFIYRFFRNLPQHKASHLIFGGLFVGVLALYVISALTGLLPKNTFLYKLLYRAYDSFRTFGRESTDLHGRTGIWGRLNADMNNAHLWMFGYGETYSLFRISAIVKSNPNALYWAHNGYLRLLYSGGILRLAIFVALVIYLAYLCFVSIFKRNVTTGLAVLFFGIVFLAHGISEDTAFLIFDTRNMAGLTLIALPLLVDLEERKGDRFEDNKQMMREIPRVTFRFRNSPVYSSFIALFLASVAFVFPSVYGILLSYSGVDFALKTINPCYIIYSIATPLLVAVAIFVAGHLERESRHQTYVVETFTASLMIALNFCYAFSVINDLIYLILGGVGLIGAFVTLLVISIRKKIHYTFQFVRFLLLFSGFYGLFYGGTLLGMLCDFDIGYFATAYLTCGWFVLVIVTAIAASQKTSLRRLTIRVAQIEVLLHAISSRMEENDKAIAER